MIKYNLYISNGDIYDIQDIFDILKESLEPGIIYKEIIDNCIIVESIYKYEYFKGIISEELLNIGYSSEFKIKEKNENKIY